MEINLTIFVQMINFLISYWFLNKYLFKPALESIKRKNLEKNNLILEIENEEKNLLIKEKSKNEQLIQFQEKVLEKYQVKTDETTLGDIPIELAIDGNKTENLVKKATNVIVEKAFNVD